MPPRADSAKEDLTFVNVTDPRQMGTSTLRRTVRSRAAVKGHDRRRERLVREAEASTSDAQSIADEEQQWQADLDQQNERAFAVASAVLTGATQPDLRWARCSDDTTTDQSTSTVDRYRIAQRLTQPRPTQGTALSGYLGVTDPRSYRLKNMRELLRHHPAHAVWLSYDGSVAASLPSLEPPCPSWGRSSRLAVEAEARTSKLRAPTAAAANNREEKKGVDTSTSAIAEALTEFVKRSSDAATPSLARIITGLQEAISEKSGFTGARKQEVAAAEESQEAQHKHSAQVELLRQCVADN
ncbi:hypothetical protein H2203_005230 [Taxawa tesnikishii (nom. ined.)]|nr:hypothetical protein H2203_005230 [Dothideales sp. JES 119]